MKKKQIISAFLALAVVVNLFIAGPKSKVLAEDPQPSPLDVSKVITWDPENPTKSTITITSNVPKVKDTQVLFLGTRCTAHGMQDDTLVKSINAVAQNADVHYELLWADSKSSGDISGDLTRGDTYSDSVTTENGGQHASLKKFCNVIKKQLTRTDRTYDYIVMEFDSSRLASDVTFNADMVSLLNEVAGLLEDYYKEDRVLWITDGFSQDTSGLSESTPYADKKDRYGVLPYTPTNIYFTYKDTRRNYLSSEKFCALCALMAPEYYLAHPPKNSFGSYTADSTYYGNGSEEFTLSSDYSLTPGHKDVKDPLYGEAPDYLVYGSDSRQMYYNNSQEVAYFLYMAIKGVTMKLNDNLHISVGDTIQISDITVSATEATNPTSTDWKSRPTFDVKNASLQVDNGIYYVEDTNKEIRVNKGNTGANLSENNRISMNIVDLKNKLTYVRVTIHVEDEEGFKSCITLKLDSNGNPLKTPEGEYQYEMNPNNGKAVVEAFKNGNNTGSGDAKGDALASAPLVDVCHVKGTVSGGTQNFDTSKQAGTIISTTSDPYLEIVTFKDDTPVYTFTPAAYHEFESIEIDGTSITLDDKGSASGSTSKGEYTVATDSKGVMTVTFPNIEENRTVDVKFAPPELKLEKSVKLPSSGTVAKAGETITYTIKVTNTGKIPVSNFTVTDAIDTTKVSFAADNDGWSYSSVTKTATYPVGTKLVPGASMDLELKVVVLPDFAGTDTLVNVAGGRYPNTTPIPNSSPANQPIKGRDIDVKYHVSGEIPTGFTTPADVKETYGSKMADAHVTAMTVAPVQGYTFDGWYLKSDLSGSKFDTTKVLNDTNFAELKNGGSELNLYGKWKATKDFTVTKTVTLEDGSAITGDVAPGTKVLYTITVKNNNADAAIDKITVTDTVDSGLTISDISDSGTVSGQTITWSNLSVTTGGTKTVTFKATVPSDLKVKKTYDNTATLTGAGDDTLDKPSNKSTFNAAPENITVAVEKVWSDGWDEHKTDKVYVKLIRTADGLSWAQVPETEISADALVLDKDHTSLTFSVPPYDDQGRAYTYRFRELDANGGNTVSEGGTINVKDANGNSIGYKTSYKDSTGPFKTQITNTYIITAKDIEIKKSSSAATVEPGGTFSYTIEVKNTREYETATSIMVKDLLPTGVTIVEPNGLVTSGDGVKIAAHIDNEVTFSISSLEPQGTAYLKITVKVDDTLTATQLKNVACIKEVGGKSYGDNEYPSNMVPTDVRTFTVSKEWKDSLSTHNGVTVELLQNGQSFDPKKTVVLDSTNEWKYTWTNLQMYDTKGEAIVYSVLETPVDGYLDPSIDYNTNNTSAKITNTMKKYSVEYSFVGPEVPENVTPPSKDENLEWGSSYSAKDKMSADGYIFSGWYTDSTCQTLYTNGMVLNETNVPSGTYHLYGTWKSVKKFKVEKTVTYNGETIDETLSPGSTVLYTITVTNLNANAAIKNVVVKDDVPAGLVNISNISNGGTLSGQTITWNLDIAKGGTVTLTFNASVPGDLKVKKTYDNVASVPTADGDKVENPEAKSPTSSFSAKPDNIYVSVTKDWSDTWDSHTSGTVYVRLFRKISSETSYTAVPNMDLIGLSSAMKSTTKSVPPYDENGNEYTYVFREVIVDQSGNETVLEEGGMNGKYQVSYADSVALITKIKNNYIIDADDLTILKTAPDTAEPGGQLEYTIKVTNDRDYEKATNIVVTDVLPDGVTLSATGGLTCSSANDKAEVDPSDPTGKTIVWTITELDHNATATLTIKVDVGADLDATQLKNVANIKTVGGTSYQPGEYPSPDALTDVRTFAVKKVWSNPSVSHDNVTVKLLQNGVEYSTGATVELGAGNNWTYKWTKLPMYDSSNNYYVYTVEEVVVTGYDTITSYYGGTYGNTSAEIKNTLKKITVDYKIVGKEEPDNVPVPANDTVDWGTKYDAQDKLSAPNYVFDGWFIDEACTTPYVDGTVLDEKTTTNERKTLYGKWTRLYTDITFQPGYGRAPVSDDVIYPNNTTGKRGDDFPMPADPICNGPDFKFDGWFLDPDCTIPYVPGPLNTAELPLYAKWVYQPMVSYQFVGDKIPSDAKLPAGGRIPEGTAYNADKTTKSTDNYTFDGWYTDKACTKKYVDGTKIYDDTILYGKWTRKTTDVELLPGVGEGPNPDDVIYPTIPTGKRGDTLPMPADPIYNGSDYKFAGWFLDPDCTIPYVPGSMTTPILKLYAKWMVNPIVRYHFVSEVPNGVSLPSIDVVTPGTAYKTLAPNGTTTLYVFDGWYLDPACTQKYVEGTKIYKDTLVYGRWLPVLPKTGESKSNRPGLSVVFLLAGAGILVFLEEDKKRRYFN